MTKTATLSILALGLIAALWAADRKPPVTEITVPTHGGHVTLKGKEAEEYSAGNAWVEARMKDAASVKVGSTYADVAKLFRHDGGLTPLNKSRLVLIRCPLIKIDVVFETPKGAKPGDPLPPTAKVVKVSKAYLEPEYLD
jgi:hypothetical protein